MPDDFTAETLLKTVTTTNSKFLLLLELEKVTAELSKTTPFAEANIQNNYPVLLKILGNKQNGTDLKIDQNFITRIKTELGKLEELEVSIPQIPNDSVDQLEQYLVEWGRTNISAFIIINIKQRADMITGITLSYRGDYRNFTLDRLIETKVYDQLRI